MPCTAQFVRSRAHPDVVSARQLYDSLYSAYGAQHWWPGQGTFEIMVGALLVQRTSWRNVEFALEELRTAGLLSAEALSVASAAQIGELIRSAGFYRTKSVRLRQLARFFVEVGGESRLACQPTSALRSLLLSLEGVGPETADSILLYAFDRPVPVIDEYLRRTVRRLDAAGDFANDDQLRGWIVEEFTDTHRLNEFHALVVAHGKRHCRSRPVCSGCPLSTSCRTCAFSGNASDA